MVDAVRGNEAGRAAILGAGQHHRVGCHSFVSVPKSERTGLGDRRSRTCVRAFAPSAGTGLRAAAPSAVSVQKALPAGRAA